MIKPSLPHLSHFLLLALICSFSSSQVSSLRNFEVSDPAINLKITGSIKQSKVRMEFQVNSSVSKRRILIWFKTKERDCPSIVFVFGNSERIEKHIYAVGACDGKGLQNDIPLMNDQLSVDFDREVDTKLDEAGLNRFSGTVQYNLDLNEYQYLTYDTIKVRTQVDNGRAEYEKDFDWKIESSSN